MSVIPIHIVMGGGGPNIQTRKFFTSFSRPYEEDDTITSNVPSSTKRDHEKKNSSFQCNRTIVLKCCYISFPDLKIHCWLLLLLWLLLLKFQQFCMHDVGRNINHRILEQLFVDYKRRCLGCELKLCHSTV